MANCGRQKFSPEMNVLNFLWIPESNDHTVLCTGTCQALFFAFEKRTFWREDVSDLECNKEIHLPLSLLKISVTLTSVTFCRTQAAMLLLCYIPRTSPLNLSNESLFFRPQYVFYSV